MNDTPHTEDDPFLDIMPAVREELRDLRQELTAALAANEALVKERDETHSRTDALFLSMSKQLEKAFSERDDAIAASNRDVEALIVRCDEVDQIRAKLEASQAECERLRKDKERLDWLESKGKYFNPGRHIHGYETITREAIDAAMQPASGEEKL